VNAERVINTPRIEDPHLGHVQAAINVPFKGPVTDFLLKNMPYRKNAHAS